ncbi:MAG: trypsin-like serine protease [Candidatus Nanopelagicaceae bacterium]
MRNLFKYSATFAAALFLTSQVLPAAQASRGGIETRNNTFVIGFTYQVGGAEYVCSGIPISPTILLTAAHCVIDKNKEKSSNYIFAEPGKEIDAAINPALIPPKILQVITGPNFRVNGINDGDDIAFIQFDKPIMTKGFINLASEQDLRGMANNTILSGYGYGAVYETNSAYSSFPRQYKLNWKAIEGGQSIPKLQELTNESSTACSGDSGGPITMKSASGEELLVGVMSGAASVIDSCGTKAANNLYQMRITVLAPYLDLVQSIYTPGEQMKYNVQKPIKKIVCVKGKVKKTITGTNPKCPKGYKIKG